MKTNEVIIETIKRRLINQLSWMQVPLEEAVDEVMRTEAALEYALLMKDLLNKKGEEDVRRN
jgi:hypothetical protein